MIQLNRRWELLKNSNRNMKELDRVELARTLWNQGKGSEAITIVENIIKEGAQTTAPFILAADILVSQNEVARASDMLIEVLKITPDSNVRIKLEQIVPQLKKKIDDKTVMMVVDYPRSRHIRISTVLRSRGWHVKLLTGATPYFNPAPFFDEILTYNNHEEALFIAKKNSADIFHLFSTWGDDTSRLFIKEKPGPVVFDPYDVVDGLYKKSGFDSVIEKQRFCLENADGITARDLRVRYVYRSLNYRKPKHIILFQDYCAQINVLNKSHLDKLDGIHTVSNGFIATGQNANDIDWGYGHLAESFAKDKIHIHFYPHPTQTDYDSTTGAFTELRKLQEKYEYVHIHKPVTMDNLVSEISKYHLGLNLIIPNLIGTTISSYTTPHFKYCSSARNIDYLDAGLPVLLNKDLYFQYRMLNRVGVAIGADKSILSAPRTLIESFLSAPNLQEKIYKATNMYSIDNHIGRLEELYNKVMS